MHLRGIKVDETMIRRSCGSYIGTFFESGLAFALDHSAIDQIRQSEIEYLNRLRFLRDSQHGLGFVARESVRTVVNQQKPKQNEHRS